MSTTVLDTRDASMSKTSNSFYPHATNALAGEIDSKSGSEFFSVLHG